jgi:AraC-like DNA-binding protein
MPHAAPIPTSTLPAPALRPCVARYLDVALDVPPAQWLVQRVSPPGGATLSFRWSGDVLLLDTDPPTRPPRHALTGPITHGGVTGCAGPLRMFVVFFTAAGAFDLLGIEMSTLANRSVDAEVVLGGWIGALGGAVAAAATTAERNSLVEAALLERLGEREVRPGLGARASALIRASIGTSPIGALAAELGVSERTLRRHFLREVGVSPKAYARWARFQQAHEYLYQPPHRAWTDAAHRFGYADQAHLIREFRHFAGQPPSHLQGDERLFDPAFVPDADGLPRMRPGGRPLQER